jgi:hypothetical protein
LQEIEQKLIYKDDDLVTQYAWMMEQLQGIRTSIRETIIDISGADNIKLCMTLFDDNESLGNVIELLEQLIDDQVVVTDDKIEESKCN